jgi:hypothetical protein
MNYQIINIAGEKFLKRDDLGIIPDDPENRHYADYLAWVADGNTAEEVTIEP